MKVGMKVKVKMRGKMLPGTRNTDQAADQQTL